MFFLGDNLQYSAKTPPKDTLDNYPNFNIENINKKNFNTLDELIKCDSSFYSEEIKAPIYKIEPSHCSEYTRKAAKDLFSKNYSGSNSWNLRYYNRIVCEVKDKEELISLAKDTLLKPGMIVGFYNPDSKYKNKIDDRKEKAKYTHVTLYIGTDGKDLQFVHQLNGRIEKINLKRIINFNLSPLEILDENSNLLNIF